MGHSSAFHLEVIRRVVVLKDNVRQDGREKARRHVGVQNEVRTPSGAWTMRLPRGDGTIDGTLWTAIPGMFSVLTALHPRHSNRTTAFKFSMSATSILANEESSPIHVLVLPNSTDRQATAMSSHPPHEMPRIP